MRSRACCCNTARGSRRLGCGPIMLINTMFLLPPSTGTMWQWCMGYSRFDLEKERSTHFIAQNAPSRPKSDSFTMKIPTPSTAENCFSIPVTASFTPAFLILFPLPKQTTIRQSDIGT